MNNYLSLDEKVYIIEYLLDQGYANDTKSAEVIVESMGQQWLLDILDEGYKNLSRKAGLMTRQAATFGVKSGGAKVGSRALETGGVRNAVRIAMGMKPKPRKKPGVEELKASSGKYAGKAAKIVAVSGSHLPGVAQEQERINRERGRLKKELKTETDREHLEKSINK